MANKSTSANVSRLGALPLWTSMRTGAGRARQWNRQFSNWLKAIRRSRCARSTSSTGHRRSRHNIMLALFHGWEIYGRKGELVGTVKGADPAQVRQYVAQAKS